MTVASTANKIIFPGNGSTTNFPFTFSVPPGASSDIGVYFTDALGNITLLASTTYTLTINAAISPNPTSVGGTVIYNPGSVPIPLGTSLTILRTLPDTQTASFVNQGALYPSTVEQEFDAVVMLTQQLNEMLGRQITVAVSDPMPASLPPVAQRASLIFGFDASGNPIAVAAAPTGVISSAMAPFVGSSTLSAAKALLGYGTMANENIGAAGKGIADDGAGNVRVSTTTSAVSTNQSVGSANHMTDYVSTGSLNYTLAKLTTLFNGFAIRVFCLSGSPTLVPNASDTINGTSGSGVGFTLRVGQCCTLIGDGVGNWYALITKFNVSTPANSETAQTFKSGTAQTYTTPAFCTRLRVRICGGGGGGATTGGGGGTGSTTSFGSTTAIGGNGGATFGSSGQGGTGGTTGTGSEIIRLAGGPGSQGQSSTGAFYIPGGTNPFGGAGGGSPGNPNTGAGGAGFGSVSSGFTGGAGGAGEYVEFIINNPAASYNYTVGAGGTSGGGSSTVGGAGVIIVEEFY